MSDYRKQVQEYVASSGPIKLMIEESKDNKQADTIDKLDPMAANAQVAIRNSEGLEVTGKSPPDRPNLLVPDKG